MSATEWSQGADGAEGTPEATPVDGTPDTTATDEEAVGAADAATDGETVVDSGAGVAGEAPA